MAFPSMKFYDKAKEYQGLVKNAAGTKAIGNIKHQIK